MRTRSDVGRGFWLLTAVATIMTVMPLAGAAAPSDELLSVDPVTQDVPEMSKDGRISAEASLGRVDSSGRVSVEIVHKPRAERALIEGDVGRLGGSVLGSSPGVTLVAVPPVAVAAIERRPDVEYVRSTLRVDLLPEPLDASGSPLDTGDIHVTATNAAAWQTAGYLGNGVKVGIVDYFDGGVWSAAQSTGDVPAPAGIFCRNEGFGCDLWSAGSAHGVAVAEILHDMAPGATLYLATAVTVTDLAAAVAWFDSQGVQIISRSLTAQLDGPGDGTGSVDAVVDDAVSRGMAWFNAAGNHASASGTANGGYWRGGFVDADVDGWMEFAPGDETLGFYCGGVQGFRWSDWQATGRTDYDIGIYGPAGNLLASSIDDQTAGKPPLEILGAINCNMYPVVYLRVHLYSAGSGTSGDILEFMVNGTAFEYSSNPYSASGPAGDSANPGLVAVGAIDPAAGAAIAPYSSQGPTNDGRIKPDLSTPSCLPSVSYAPSCFNGTSAATPVAAGAAALVWGSGVATTPQTVAQYLTTHVIDRGTNGRDNVYGSGQLYLGQPPEASDAGPPELTGVVVSSSTVANDGTGEVTVTITAEDDVSGVQALDIGWRNPSDSITFSVPMYDPVDRIFGTENAGTWSDSAVMPQFSEVGTWTLLYVDLIDDLDNRRVLSPPDIAALGITVSDLTVTGGSGDGVPPVLVSASATPDPVAVGSTVDFLWRLRDESGVSSTWFQVRNAATGASVPFSSDCLVDRVVSLASGTPEDGTYEASCLMPLSVASGEWTLRVLARDTAGIEALIAATTFAVSDEGPAPPPAAPVITLDKTVVTPSDHTVVATGEWVKYHVKTSNTSTTEGVTIKTLTDDVGGVQYNLLAAPGSGDLRNNTCNETIPMVIATGDFVECSFELWVDADATSAADARCDADVIDVVTAKGIGNTTSAVTNEASDCEEIDIDLTPVNTFVDDDTSIFEGDIEWLAAQGITRGCNPPINDWYCPRREITRGELAAFLRRALALPSGQGDTFIDDDTSIFESDIEALVAAGIKVSCNDEGTMFCPNQPLAREIMAQFLVAAFKFDPVAEDYFIDDEESPHEPDINSIAAIEVTRGCNPPTNDKYCPLRIVNRGEMAAFFHRAFLLRQ